VVAEGPEPVWDAYRRVHPEVVERRKERQELEKHAVGRVNYQPGRLIDDHQLLIFNHNVQGNGFRLECRYRRRGEVQRQDLTGLHGPAGFGNRPGVAVGSRRQQHITLPDQFLDLGTG
jgi:hypothetical protein